MAEFSGQSMPGDVKCIEQICCECGSYFLSSHFWKISDGRDSFFSTSRKKNFIGQLLTVIRNRQIRIYLTISNPHNRIINLLVIFHKSFFLSLSIFRVSQMYFWPYNSESREATTESLRTFRFINIVVRFISFGYFIWKC